VRERTGFPTITSTNNKSNVYFIVDRSTSIRDSPAVLAMFERFAKAFREQCDVLLPMADTHYRSFSGGTSDEGNPIFTPHTLESLFVQHNNNDAKGSNITGAMVYSLKVFEFLQKILENGKIIAFLFTDCDDSNRGKIIQKCYEQFFSSIRCFGVLVMYNRSNIINKRKIQSVRKDLSLDDRGLGMMAIDVSPQDEVESRIGEVEKMLQTFTDT